MQASIRRRIEKVMDLYKKLSPLEETKPNEGEGEKTLEALFNELINKFGEEEVERFLESKGFIRAVVEEPAATTYITHSGMFESVSENIKKAAEIIANMGEDGRKERGLEYLDNENVLFTSFVGFLSELPFEEWFGILSTASLSAEAIVNAYSKGAREKRNPLELLR